MMPQEFAVLSGEEFCCVLRQRNNEDFPLHPVIQPLIGKPEFLKALLDDFSSIPKACAPFLLFCRWLAVLCSKIVHCAVEPIREMELSRSSCVANAPEKQPLIEPNSVVYTR